MATETEIWKPVVGYEARYSISSRGRLRKEWYSRKRPAGYILKTPPGKHGYPMASTIAVSGQKEKRVTIHSLVAAAFLGPRPPGHEVNHKNGIKADNRVENLEYVTPSQNVRHSIDVLGARVARGEQSGRAKLTAMGVRVIRRAVQTGCRRKFLAECFGVTERQITQIVLGKSWRSVECRSMPTATT